MFQDVMGVIHFIGHLTNLAVRIAVAKFLDVWRAPTQPALLWIFRIPRYIGLPSKRGTPSPANSQNTTDRSIIWTRRKNMPFLRYLLRRMPDLLRNTTLSRCYEKCRSLLQTVNAGIQAVFDLPTIVLYLEQQNLIPAELGNAAKRFFVAMLTSDTRAMCRGSGRPQEVASVTHFAGRLINLIWRKNLVSRLRCA